MWKEILDFQTKNGKVGEVLEQEKRPTGIAGVSNTGNNSEWCGSLFHPVNLYAFGRLAWDWTLDSKLIAKEWAMQSWGPDPELVHTIERILLHSWEACVDYMTPLGLHHIMRYNHHYGPDPGCTEGTREDWKPPYYHRADAEGLGFDRTRTGSGAVDQYAPPIANMFNDIHTCPEKYLLWFHHVPWDFVLDSGRTLKDELVFRYHRGVEQAEQLRAWWKSIKDKVPPGAYRTVLAKFDLQVASAHEWEEVCVKYFLSFTNPKD